jgi:hypothetical protein
MVVKKKVFRLTMVPHLKTTTPVARSRAGQDIIMNHDVIMTGQGPSHTGEPGLRITWNFWRNDEYTDRPPIFCEIRGHIVKIFGDQHGCWMDEGQH